MKESFIRLYKRITFTGQMLRFLRTKKIYALICKSLIDFNEALIPYNDPGVETWVQPRLNLGFIWVDPASK